MLSGIRNLELIHRGSRHAVYRGEQDGRAVVVKKNAAELPGADAIASLRHEYTVLRALDVPGVVKLRGIARAGAGLALILEDVGQQTLAEKLGGEALPIGEFLELAVQIAQSVAGLHGARVVHRDINPTNIVWNVVGRRATLIDFGIATTLSGLTIESTTPALLEGTLRYISPEQTGRIGRAVDSRTDLYSLGATLYEMLTGTPPFAALDPVELVHAHLARRPRPPHEVNAEVPLLLSRIVLKLLEKEPEQRYQTAEALGTDLQEAKNQWARTGAIVPFPLASHDVPRELSISDKLYGRDNEIRTIREAFIRACRGRREIVVVTGEPGIGKSALVNQVEQPVAERRGLFAAGKFDQLQRSVPYSGLVQAFRNLVRHLLTEPEPALAIWRERIQGAVTPNGQVLVGLIHEVERIIGPQPPVPELGPVESKNRFTLVLTAFLNVFARPQHPFALFLDDLQWVDAGSLQLLEQWMADAQSRDFLLIGAYRDAEVGPEHPLTRSLAEMREAGTPIQEIHLTPIGREDIAELISDALKQEIAKVRPLAELVAKKTAGNPFFVRRLLHTLYAEKLLRFSARTGGWQWDLSKLEQAPLSDNVLDLMVQAIERLPAETRKLLEAAACIGHRFDLGTLAEVTGLSRTEATRQLWPALEDGLLVPLGETYKAPRREGPLDESLGELPGTVQFVHDRVQQAAYSRLTNERRQALHLDIGRRLLQWASNGQLEDRLFDVVDQLDLGETLVEEPTEHLRLAELNLAAGRKAKVSAAYSAGCKYLTVGVRHLPATAWQEHGALAFALHRELAECAYLSGQHTRAEEIVGVAMEHAPSKSVKLELYCLRVLAATDAGDYARALELGREGLVLLGLEWPRERLEDTIETEAAAVMDNVRGRRIEDLALEPEAADEEARVAMRLLSILGPPAYFSSDSNVLQFAVMRLVNLSLLRGPSAYSAYGYTFYGAIHNGRTGDYETGHAFGRLAVALARRFGNRGEESRTLEVFGLIVNPWRAPLRSNVALFKEGYRAGIESGELQYAAYNLHALLINGLPLGAPLPELLKDVEASLEFSTKHKNKTMVDFTLPFRQGVRNLTGQTRARATFDDDDFEERRYFEDAKDQLTALAFYWVIRLQAAYLFGDYQDARQYSNAAKKVLPSAMGMVIEAEHAFYTALTLAALSETPGEGDRQPALTTELEALEAKLSTWAKHCPENFRHKEQLVAAERARTEGDFWRAQQHYSKAIESAAREGFIQDEALANELRGRFALAHGERHVASLYLRAARDGYARWGATAKVRELEKVHPDFLTTHDARPSRMSSSVPELAIDALGLIKASQAISAETAPARLFERILRIVIEVAGAQKGVLLLGQPGELKVHARVAAEEGVATLLEEVPLADAHDLARGPIRYVARLKEPLVLADASAEGAFASDREVRELRIRSVLCVPLKKQAEIVGLLYLENNAMAGAFTQERVDVVQSLAAQAVISLENSTLLLERERAEHTAQFLARAGAALVESLDHSKTLARVVQLAVPTIADWCLLDLVGEDGDIRRVEVVHAAPADAGLANEVKRFTARPEGNGNHLPTAALVEGRAVLQADISDQRLREMALDEEHLRVMRAMGCRSVISAPLVARGRTLGVLTFILTHSGRRYDHADLAAALELAKRCALAIDNARLYEDAQNAIRVRDDFLLIASHELKTPLTPLQLQLHMLGHRLKDFVKDGMEAWLDERLATIQRQADRLERLVAELLDISRIIGGRLQLELGEVDIAALVRDVVADLREQGAPERAGSDVRVEGGTGAILGTWDRMRIEQVVTNLMTNALKYGQGNPITVRVTADEETATVSVEDHGIGIASQDQERIFGRFERAVSSSHYGGLGLGLFIVRQVVEAMGGRITVASQLGKGATFTLRLPRRPPPRPAPIEPAPTLPGA